MNGPGAVTYWIDTSKIDTTGVKIEIPEIEPPKIDFGITPSPAPNQ